MKPELDKMSLAVGVDLGGTNLRAALVDVETPVRSFIGDDAKRPVADHQPAAVAELVAARGTARSIRRARRVGVGVGVAAMLRGWTGVVVNAPNSAGARSTCREPAARAGSARASRALQRPQRHRLRRGDVRRRQGRARCAVRVRRHRRGRGHRRRRQAADRRYPPGGRAGTRQGGAGRAAVRLRAARLPGGLRLGKKYSGPRARRAGRRAWRWSWRAASIGARRSPRRSGPWRRCLRRSRLWDGGGRPSRASRWPTSRHRCSTRAAW